LKKLSVLFILIFFISAFWSCTGRASNPTINVDTGYTATKQSAAAPTGAEDNDLFWWLKKTAAPETEPGTTPESESTSGDATSESAAGETAGESETADSSGPLPEGTVIRKDKYEFTKDPNNKYIASVLEGYDADPQNLAVIVPLEGDDKVYVLQFNGTVNEERELVKTAETFVKAYLLDMDGQVISIAASKTEDRFNINSVENTSSVLAIKRYIIPIFQEELND